MQAHVQNAVFISWLDAHALDAQRVFQLKLCDDPLWVLYFCTQMIIDISRSLRLATLFQHQRIMRQIYHSRALIPTTSSYMQNAPCGEPTRLGGVFARGYGKVCPHYNEASNRRK